MSVEDESRLLDDYLAMERLRFNFNYQIKIVESTDLLQVEIPTMLLQPFVENASSIVCRPWVDKAKYQFNLRQQTRI
jgi:LytS/YehU family sensor histidine kinase